MGTERWYIALPNDSEILRRAVVDADYGEFLGLPFWIDEPPPLAGRDPTATNFLADVAALKARYPGLASWAYTLDRQYDAIEYLLSPARRDETDDPDHWGTRAVRGSHPLPESVRGGQGHPSRHSTAADVRAIAVELERLTLDDLLLAYDPAGMVAEDVYKFRQQSGDPAMFGLLVAYFGHFRDFYRSLAREGLGLVAVVT